MAVLSENYGQMSLPGSTGGDNWFDFITLSDNLPPSEAARNVTQFEEGGSGFNFDINQGLKDLAGMWLANEAREDRQTTAAPVQYRRSENGQLYVTDPAYRSQVAGSIGGVPLMWVAMGAAVLLAVMMVKD